MQLKQTTPKNVSFMRLYGPSLKQLLVTKLMNNWCIRASLETKLSSNFRLQEYLSYSPLLEEFSESDEMYVRVLDV